MRLRLLVCLLLLSTLSLPAQVTLYSENFNNCALPAGWQVNVSGNPAPTWSVGISQNNDAPGQSIDGSCFLFIDDESEGNNTPAYTISFTSPAFDASQHTKVELSMDVHYHDWDGANDYLSIFVLDGTTEKLISRFDEFRKNGSNISDHFTLKADLALLTQSPTARLIIRYSDGGGEWVWWAGVDNIKITGSGTGSNVIRETFSGCAKPAGWTTELLSGSDNWQFGLLQPGSNALQGGNSMDGTCFAYFNDDENGGDATFSKARLYTPWIDGTPFSNFELNYDLIMRHYKDKVRVLVQHASGEEFVVQETFSDVGGPYFPNYVHQRFDISLYRAQQMRIVFEYWDGNDWSWWAGVDNVKVTGSGVAHDQCSQAITLPTGGACTLENNISSTFNGPAPACVDRSVGALWYRWQAPFTGTAKLTTQARFNDLVTVFTGGCASPATVQCNNRDEHGFTGETTYFPAQSGTEYLIRVSGVEGGFGVPRGELCVGVVQETAPAPPANDNCATATSLTVNGACFAGTNLHASTSPTLPSLNLLARADVWYTFTAGTLGAGENLEIRSNASFSDIITLYSGGCNALQEVAGNHKGGLLELPALTTGQQYWIQIAGNFATVEGSLCAQILKKQSNPPANDECAGAVSVPVGGQCTAGNNMTASFSGYVPACAVSVDRDIWFSFTAPASGSVRLNTGADFDHTLAVWQGACSGLTQVFCAQNPLRCNGFASVNGLTAGQTYYVQVASRDDVAGLSGGAVCLKITDGANAPDYVAMTLGVVENCTGEDVAELQVTVGGGVQPYTFAGNTNGQSLPSGATYLVVVTDAIGCEQSVGGTVDNCDAICTLAATIQAVEPKCFGAATGVLTVNPSGGMTPYSYKWSNNAVTASITGLTAGTYSVTVIDAQGCETILSRTLNAPQQIVVTPETVQPKCFGDANGTITANVAGGISPYQYKWSNNSMAATIANLPAGSYTVTVSDANGCSSTMTQQLSAPNALTLNPGVQHPKCAGNSDGSVAANAGGGTAPYHYQWSNNDTTATVNNLPAGVYTVTVTDANGCSSTASRTLTPPQVIQIDQEDAIKPTQGQSNGALGVTVTGGIQPYTYIWFKNNVLFSSGSEDLIDLAAGEYRLEITDANGCKATYTYNLTETVGTTNPGEAFYAEVFPNPASDWATLAVAFPQPQSLSLSLVDAAGRIVQTWMVDQVTEQHIPLDLKDLPAGVYRLRIMAGEEMVGRMLVVGR